MSFDKTDAAGGAPHSDKLLEGSLISGNSAESGGRHAKSGSGPTGADCKVPVGVRTKTGFWVRFPAADQTAF